MLYVYVALGGALGAVVRFALGSWVLHHAGDGFPWPTLLINVTGSLLLGWLLRTFPAADAAPVARALLAVGFCGAYTTFSTFGYETLTLLEARSYAAAAGYVASSVLLGLAAVATGAWLAARTAG
ncbi:MAG TPA: fluoride efflux transporter CrcB [Longimicrobiaceae bacterium]|jgi:CrcB protein|nr:fluoride efflux transporter CrcB [Longimicrobiaceae bacterium]